MRFGTGSRWGRAAAAALVAAGLAVWTQGCAARRDARAVVRELVQIAERTADILAAAKSIDDLKAREGELRELVRRRKALDKDIRRIGKAPPDVAAEYGPRMDAALKKMLETISSWEKEAKTEMWKFANDLAVR